MHLAGHKFRATDQTVKDFFAGSLCRGLIFKMVTLCFQASNVSHNVHASICLLRSYYISASYQTTFARYRHLAGLYANESAEGGLIAQLLSCSMNARLYSTDAAAPACGKTGRG